MIISSHMFDLSKVKEGHVLLFKAQGEKQADWTTAIISKVSRKSITVHYKSGEATWGFIDITPDQVVSKEVVIHYLGDLSMLGLSTGREKG